MPCRVSVARQPGMARSARCGHNPPTESAHTPFFSWFVDLIEKPTPPPPPLRPRWPLYFSPLVQCMDAATLGMPLEAGP